MIRINSQRIKVNGLDIHYLTYGSGEPLIIVHGGGDGARAWTKNIIALSKKYTVYVPDLPGFGSSQAMANAYYMTEMVDFIDDFSSSLGLRSFYMMGHSFGGGVALHYTLKHPQKIRKLVLVSSLCLGREIAWWIRIFSTPVFYHSIGNAVVAFFRFIKKAAKVFGPWEIVEPVSKTTLHIGSRISSLTEQTINLISQLSQIMVPTLVMWGAKDPIVPFNHAYAAAELIPDCKVKIFGNAGHSVYRDRLHEFSTALAGFLG